MNRKYHPPETQDQRRKIGTDQPTPPAPDAAALQDSAPYSGNDLEFEGRPPGTEFSLARKEFEFADTRSFRKELADALCRLRDAPENAGRYTDLSAYIELLRSAPSPISPLLQLEPTSSISGNWRQSALVAKLGSKRNSMRGGRAVAFGRRRAATGTRPTGRP
jgi:hypothetical protein